MTRKKSDDDLKTISFRCPADVADDLKILARIDGSTSSDFLRELASSLVAANKQRILEFKQSAAVPLKKSATFAAPTPKPAENNSGTISDNKGGDPQ